MCERGDDGGTRSVCVCVYVQEGLCVFVVKTVYMLLVPFIL